VKGLFQAEESHVGHCTCKKLGLEQTILEKQETNLYKTEKHFPREIVNSEKAKNEIYAANGP